MLEQIRAYINHVMEKYSDSRQPTGDEVMIAWLVTEIDKIKLENEIEVIKRKHLEEAIKKWWNDHKHDVYDSGEYSIYDEAPYFIRLIGEEK